MGGSAPCPATLLQALTVVNAAHAVLGPTPLRAISTALNKWTGHMVPEWNPYMPKVGRVG